MPESHNTGRLFETEGVSNPLDLLKRIYGYSTFRGQQQAVVDHVVAGGDAVVLFPTGRENRSASRSRRSAAGASASSFRR